jgi:hypothetical protein
LNEPECSAAASRSLGATALIALLVVSLVLGILVYRARTPDLALEVTKFPREFTGAGVAEFEFFVRFDEPEARIEIVGRNQVIARTLEPALSVKAGELITCVWDGQLDEGGIAADGGTAPPGRYRLRVTLPGEDRQMVFPRRLDVEPGNALDGGGNAMAFEPCATGEAS